MSLELLKIASLGNYYILACGCDLRHRQEYLPKLFEAEPFMNRQTRKVAP